MAKFKALSMGTMSNPYRTIDKDQIVELSNEEAAFYAKSKWLRPLDEVLGMKPQPLMSHMTVDNPSAKRGTDGIEAMTLINRQNFADKVLAPSPTPSNYDMQMEAIKRKEAIEDANAAAVNLPLGTTLSVEGETKPGEEAATGTGNQDPLA